VNVFVTQVPAPVAVPVPLIVCSGWSSLLTVSFPLNAAISWYDSASGGNLLGTGLAFTTPPITATSTFYAEANINGCIGARTPVTVLLGGCKNGGTPETEISNQSECKISLFPNPTEGLVRIDFADANTSRIQLRLYDAGGKLVLVDEKSSVQRETGYHETLDLTSFPRGMYLLQIVTDSYTLKRKISLQ
jgi:hypothetical protein